MVWGIFLPLVSNNVTKPFLITRNGDVLWIIICHLTKSASVVETVCVSYMAISNPT